MKERGFLPLGLALLFVMTLSVKAGSITTTEIVAKATDAALS